MHLLNVVNELAHNYFNNNTNPYVISLQLMGIFFFADRLGFEIGMPSSECI